MTKEFKEWIANNGKLTTKFSEWYYEDTIPHLPFGRVIYIVMGQKLYAAKIIECAYLTNTMKYGDRSWFIHLNIAGKGHFFQNLHDFEWNYKGYYLTKEDYEDFVEGNANVCHKFITKDGWKTSNYIASTYGCHLKEINCWYRYCNTYTAKSGAIKADDGNPLTINYLYVDEYGIHTNTDWMAEYSWDAVKVYNNPEDAIRASRVSEVVEFDEEPKAEEKPNKDKLVVEITNIMVELSADKLADLLNEIRDN